MKRGLQILATLAAAALPVVLADRLLQPVPIPAATAAVGGLLGLWLGRGLGWGRVGIGVGVGMVLGAAWHGHAHWSGQSTPPAEGLAAHLAVDAAIGFAVAVPALGLALAVRRWLEGRGG